MFFGICGSLFETSVKFSKLETLSNLLKNQHKELIIRCIIAIIIGLLLVLTIIAFELKCCMRLGTKVVKEALTGHISSEPHNIFFILKIAFV